MSFHSDYGLSAGMLASGFAASLTGALVQSMATAHQAASFEEAAFTTVRKMRHYIGQLDHENARLRRLVRSLAERCEAAESALLAE